MAVIGKPTYGFKQVRPDSTSHKKGTNRSAQTSAGKGISKYHTNGSDSSAVKDYYVKKLWDKKNHDYLIRLNGQIMRRENKLGFDAFFVEFKSEKQDQMIVRWYKKVAELKVNEYGLVNFPASSYNDLCFDRYGDVQKKAIVKGKKFNKRQKKFIYFTESVGEGDHYIFPETAAALFGVLNDMSKLNVFVSLGDMSSYNGSDPGSSTFHHSGHGHMGKRSGLDVDFRYINTNGKSFRGVMTAKEFSKKYNELLYKSAFKYGFSKSSTFRGKSKVLTGVAAVDGHNDHGHLGYDDKFTNIIDVDTK